MAGTSYLTLLAPAFSGINEYTLMNASGTANTFGPWTQIGTLPPYKTNRLLLTGRPDNNNTSQSGLINIGVGPSGSQQILIPNLLVNAITGFGGPPLNPMFPIKMPPGEDIWAQYSIPSTSVDNYEIGGLAWCEHGDEIEEIIPYVDAAASQGFSVALSASGAWGPVTLSSSTSRSRKYIFAFTNLGEPGSYISASLSLSVGSQVIFPALVCYISNGGNGTVTTPTYYGPYDCIIPEGQTLTASGYASIGAATSIQIAFYGLN